MAKVKIGEIEATYIADIDNKEKDTFGYPLGTLWKRVTGPGMFFVPANRVERVNGVLQEIQKK